MWDCNSWESECSWDILKKIGSWLASIVKGNVVNVFMYLKAEQRNKGEKSNYIGDVSGKIFFKGDFHLPKVE